MDFLGFEIHIVVIMKGIMFWNVTPYSPVVHRSFGGTPANFHQLHGVTSQKLVLIQGRDNFP
jgi:hypothetical protein